MNSLYSFIQDCSYHWGHHVCHIIIVCENNIFEAKSLQDLRMQAGKCHCSCSHSLYLSPLHTDTSLIMSGSKGPPSIVAGGEICSWWQIQRGAVSGQRVAAVCRVISPLLGPFCEFLFSGRIMRDVNFWTTTHTNPSGETPCLSCEAIITQWACLAFCVSAQIDWAEVQIYSCLCFIWEARVSLGSVWSLTDSVPQKKTLMLLSGITLT